MKKSNQNGFTLVEVIVVSVIVAVLSLSATMIYRGYVEESQQNIANNLASSASRFLQTAINLDKDINSNDFVDLIKEGDKWTINFLSGGQSTFTCPKDVKITLDKTNKIVSVLYKGKMGICKYDQ